MGWSEKRGNTWRARFKLPDGTYDSKSGFENKPQADAYWQAQETDVRRGDWFDPSEGAEVTVGQWSDRWLATLDLAPESVYTYEKRINAQIKPRWEHITLPNVTTGDYLIWKKTLHSKLGKTYADQVTQQFSMMMSDAVTHRPPLIKSSPVPLENRRRGRYVAPVEDEVLSIEAAQVLELASNAFVIWGLTGYVFILLKAFCGLRQAEMYGLRREWCYPNWPASDPGWPGNPGGKMVERKRLRTVRARYAEMPAIRVQWQHQYVRPPEGGRRVPELVLPKYGSVRNLVIPPFLAELLVALLKSHDSEWVFPSFGGGSLLKTDFSEYIWQPIIGGADERVGRFARPKIEPVEGLEDAVPHWLRHAMKGWLDEDGCHSRVAIEERMGHKLQGVEATYSRVTVAMERQIAKSLQERWESAVKLISHTPPI